MADVAIARQKRHLRNGKISREEQILGVSEALFDEVFLGGGASEIAPFTDTFLYDLKAMSEKTHLALTGRDNGEILDNLRYLDAIGARVEVRIPFAPALNGGEIEKIARFLGTLSCVCAVRVLPYHAGAASKYGALGMKYAVSALPPTEEELLLAEETVRRLSGIPCRR